MSFLCPVVESLSKSRQPLPHLEAIYVVVPSEENIEFIKKDFSGTSPMYKTAHIFFLESKSLSIFLYPVMYVCIGRSLYVLIIWLALLFTSCLCCAEVPTTLFSKLGASKAAKSELKLMYMFMYFTYVHV